MVRVYDNTGKLIEVTTIEDAWQVYRVNVFAGTITLEYAE